MLQPDAAAVRAIEDGSFASVNAAADARIDAYNAKSNESLTLIARGSGCGVRDGMEGVGRRRWPPTWTALEPAARPTSGELRRGAQRDPRSSTTAASGMTRSQLATGTGPESANTVFNAFDASLADTLDQVSRDASDGLSARQPGLIVGAILHLPGRSGRGTARPPRASPPDCGSTDEAHEQGLRRSSSSAGRSRLLIALATACLTWCRPAPCSATRRRRCPTAPASPAPTSAARAGTPEPCRQPAGLLRPRRRAAAPERSAAAARRWPRSASAAG